MEDVLVKGFGLNQEWRGFACEVTGTLRDAMEIHGLTMAQGRMLGKAILTAVLIAASHDSPKTTGIAIKDDAKRFSLAVEIDPSFRVKALPEFHEEPEEGGPATLSILVDLGLKTPYTSILPMNLEDMGRGIDDYFAQSAQILSKAKLYVNFDENGKLTRAFAYLVQALPGASEETKKTMFDRFETMMSSEALEFREVSMECILALLFKADLGAELQRFPIAYRCSCSRDLAEEMFRVLGEDELRSILKENHTVRVDCPFCKKSYYFTVEDLEKILREIKKVNRA